MDFCKFEDFKVILLAIEETPEGANGRKGYLTLGELLKKDLIDGIVTLTECMLFSYEDEMLLSDILKGDSFFIPFIEELEHRKEEMAAIKQETEEQQENRINIFSL